MSNKQIARELDIAETAVKTHVSAILRKLGATSRVHAIVMAGEEDLNGTSPSEWRVNGPLTAYLTASSSAVV